MILVGLSLAAGCGSSGSEESGQAAKATAEAEPTEVAEPEAPKNAVLFFGDTTHRKAFTVLADGTFERLSKKDESFFRAVPRAAGGAWIAAKDHIYRYDGELTAITKPEQSLGARAEAPDGTLWAVGKGVIASYRDGAWNEMKLAEIDPKLNYASGLEIGPDGTVYLLDRRAGVFAFDGTNGSKLELVDPLDGEAVEYLAVGKPGVFVATKKGIRVLRDGALHMLKRHNETYLTVFPAISSDALWYSVKGLYRYDGSQIERISKAGGTIGFPRAGSDGAVYMKDPKSKFRILRVAADGAVTRLPRDGKLDYPIKKLFVDPANRVWTVTEQGVAIIEGEKVTYWTAGTIEELPWKVNEIVFLGEGAAPPDTGGARLIDVVGKLVDDDGKPVAKAKIEICNKPTSVYSGRSPCAMNDWKEKTTSAADGSFKIEKVPAGSWHFITGYKGKWYSHRLPGCCSKIESGGTFDAGTVKVVP